MKKLLWLTMLVLLTGCLDYTSVLNITGDGSGTLKVKVKFPKDNNLGVQFTDNLDDDELPQGWETTYNGIDTLTDHLLYRFEGKFRDLKTINAFLESESETGQPAITSSVVDGKTRFVIKHRVEPFDENDKRSMKLMMKLFGGKQDLAGHYWTEKLVVEGNIVASNAAEKKGDTLIWKTVMKNFIDRGLMMDAVWEVR